MELKYNAFSVQPTLFLPWDSELERVTFPRSPSRSFLPVFFVLE